MSTLPPNKEDTNNDDSKQLSPIENNRELEKKRNTSLIKAVFNLTKSAIGLGAIFLAGNIRRMGLIGGIMMIIIGAWTSAISLHLLAQLAQYQGVGDYFELGMAAFGPRMALVDTIALVIFQMGGLIAYSKFAGSYLSSAIQLFVNNNQSNIVKIPWWRGYRFLSLAVSFGLIFPVSLLEDMSILGYTSIAGMLCIFYIAILTIVDYAINARHVVNTTKYSLFRFQSDFLSAFSSILFAYVNQFTLVALIAVLKRPTGKRRGALVSSSSLIVSAVYLAMGICGYMHFGDVVPEDILSANTTMWYAVGRLLVSVILVCSYPLQLLPTRSACDHLLLSSLSNRNNTTNNNNLTAGGRMKKWLRQAKWQRHVMWTVVLVAIPVIIAVTAVDYVQPLLELSSSACGALLVYVLPSIYFLKLSFSFKGKRKENQEAIKENNNENDNNNESQANLLRTSSSVNTNKGRMPARLTEIIMAYVNLIFGVVVCIGGTVGAFISIVESIMKKP